MLEEILKYQSIDSDLVASESELANSKDRKSAGEIQQLLKNEHSRLVVMEKTAENVNGAYKKATEKFDAYMKKLEALEKEMQTADPEKVSVYEKAYKDFSDIVSVLEKDIANMYLQVQQISKEYEDIIKKSKNEREKFDKFKASYNKLKATVEPKIEELKKQLEAQSKMVDEKVLATYKQKREGHMFPVFVELASNKCGGCRMEISASKLGSMKNNAFGVVECENCGRFNYKK